MDFLFSYIDSKPKGGLKRLIIISLFLLITIFSSAGYSWYKSLEMHPYTPFADPYEVGFMNYQPYTAEQGRAFGYFFFRAKKIPVYEESSSLRKDSSYLSLEEHDKSIAHSVLLTAKDAVIDKKQSSLRAKQRVKEKLMFHLGVWIGFVILWILIAKFITLYQFKRAAYNKKIKEMEGSD